MGSINSNPAQSTAAVSTYSNMDASNMDTVTPLHLLGDQSDTVDCPFCRRRTETRVKKTASGMTQYVFRYHDPKPMFRTQTGMH